MAQVWLGDQQLTNVTRVEIGPLDVDDNHPVTVKLTLLDPEFAVEGDLTLNDIVGLPG